jgi:hypothetical protein
MAQTPPGAYGPSIGGSSGGSSSSSYVGPVINITNTSYGAVSGAADNSTAFAAVATAATAASYVTVGTPTIRAVTNVAGSSTAVGSITIPVVIQTGDTCLVFVFGVNSSSGGDTVTVTATGNKFYPITSNVLGGSGANTQIFSTAPGAGIAYTGSITITDTATAALGATAVDAYNVGSFGQFYNMSGASTTPTATITTQDANNLILSGTSWYVASTTTFAAATGTVQASSGGTAASYGHAVISNSAASILTALTTSGTISTSSAWGIDTVELRSAYTAIPTIYCPSGTYNYSSGLNFIYPVDFEGAPGCVLNYTGTAHAMDLCAPGLTGVGTNSYVFPRFTINNVKFTGGAQSTEGIYINSYCILVTISNSTFLNFGSPTGYAIYGASHNDDLLAEFNTIWNYDANIHNWFFSGATTDENIRLIGNYAVNIFGQFGTQNGLSSGNTGIAANLSGSAAIVSENYFAYFCPEIAIGAGAFGMKISNNNFEQITASGCPAITYATGADGLKIINNYADLNNNNFFVAPLNGTQTLVNTTVSGNSIYVTPTTTALVNMNNLTGQTGNIAFQNNCAAGLGSGSSPCPITHTIAGNINQWNNDYAPVLTYAATSTASYSFQTTYGVAPKCTITPINPGVILFTTTVLSTTTLTVTTSAPFTGVVDATCNPDAQ